MVAPDPLSHWIVLVDIEDYSLRAETAQATLHDELYRVVEFALARAGLDLGVCPAQDRGDGVLILVPDGTSPTRLLRELVRGLDDALVEHHGKYNDEHRMRLRVGLHQGLVIRRGERWDGTAVNDLARLVDAGPVKQVLARARRAHLVVVVSDQVHRSVVLGRYPGIDPAAYLPADFVTKHGEPRRGWVTVPGYPAPPGLPADAGEPPRDRGRPGDSPHTGGTAGAAGGGTDTGSPVPPPALHFTGVTGSQIAVGDGAIAVAGDYVHGDKSVHPAPGALRTAEHHATPAPPAATPVSTPQPTTTPHGASQPTTTTAPEDLDPDGPGDASGPPAQGSGAMPGDARTAAPGGSGGASGISAQGGGAVHRADRPTAAPGASASGDLAANGPGGASGISVQGGAAVRRDGSGGRS
ncbi:hypothetical protein GCM10010129_44730 [Streptomyces fumigatiscleroticus]|nr:hypothetical protein GCM10010129_44730 [Streptomyces fumigatiscleroticus]